MKMARDVGGQYGIGPVRSNAIPDDVTDNHKSSQPLIPRENPKSSPTSVRSRKIAVSSELSDLTPTQAISVVSGFAQQPVTPPYASTADQTKDRAFKLFDGISGNDGLSQEFIAWANNFIDQSDGYLVVDCMYQYLSQRVGQRASPDFKKVMDKAAAKFITLGHKGEGADALMFG